MTPKEAYNEVRKKADEARMTITEYCISKKVSPTTVSRWKKKSKKCTVTMSVYYKLTN